MQEQLNNNLHRLLRHLDSIKDTLPMVVLLLQPYNKKANLKFQEFIENNTDEIEDEDGKKGINVKPEEVRIFEQLSKISITSNLAMKIIPESLFVSLISQYDAYLNDLLKILFEIRPEYINNSEKELTFSQLTKFDSIESAREYVVEKEVDTVLRKSHSEHFDYLENKLGMTLRKDLPIWQTFIEITERRNLFVHCDGIVSNQYLKVCSDHKCNIENVKINDRLNVDAAYFRKAYECIYEISTKLTHTIWRKLFKDDFEDADKQLNEICYSLLMSREYKLADILLDFAFKQTKHFNDLTKNIFIVNKSLSQHLQGKNELAKEVINSKDWSASSDDFKLAHLIINEKHDEICALMKKIGKNGDVDRLEYKSWPLFYNLRNEDKFKETYKEIFGEEYTVIEIPKKPVQELIEDVISKNPEIKEKVNTKEVKNETVKAEVSSSKDAEVPKKRKYTKKTHYKG